LDFYGTLVGGDRAAVEQVCRRIIDRYGLPMRPEELGVAWGKGYFALCESCNDGSFRTLHQIECDSLVETLRAWIGPIDPEPLVEGLRQWLRGPQVFPDTLPVLGELRRRGIRTCIVSNADHDDLLWAMKVTGISADHVVSSESARSYKPHPAIFLQALSDTGWSPGRVIHVGDSLHSDVGGARTVGLRAAWVCREGRISDIGTAVPDHTFADLWGLLGVLG